MSNFGGLVVTNKGRILQAKALTGVELNFTRMALGDGELGGSSIADLTTLKHEVKSLVLTSIRRLTGGKVKVAAILTNQGLSSGFYFREWGLFAQDPDDGEILYCYGNAAANAEYIPAGGGADIIEKHLNVVAIVGNAANVTAVIDESLVYVSVSDYAAYQSEVNEALNALSENVQDSLQPGKNNTDVQEIKALLLETDTRKCTATRQNGVITSLTSVDPADDSTVANISINRTSGTVTSMNKTAGGKTITYTVTRELGQIVSIAKGVG